MLTTRLPGVSLQPMSGATSSGDGFEFGRWETPFENAGVWIESVVYDPPSLAVRVSVHQTEWHVSESALSPERTYRVGFSRISAFRVLDEHGLLELWGNTQDEGRPGSCTFQVRNHMWTHESPLSFLMSDGWSYVIATDAECVEIVDRGEAPPEITLEQS
jgi:hypothetical protein